MTRFAPKDHAHFWERGILRMGTLFRGWGTGGYASKRGSAGVMFRKSGCPAKTRLRKRQPGLAKTALRPTRDGDRMWMQVAVNHAKFQSHPKLLPLPSAPAIASVLDFCAYLIERTPRDTFFGHQSCLTGRSSRLIFNSLTSDGIPPDATLGIKMPGPRAQLFGRVPFNKGLDRAFATRENPKPAENTKRGKGFCFFPKRGLEGI